MEESNSIKRTKTYFPNISPRSWEHPADRAALEALRKVPGLDLLLQKLIGATTERSLRLISLASSVRVTETQFAKVYKLHREACAILDAPKVPELYVSQNPFLNAGAVGVENPFIVLNSSMIDALSEEELLSVLGHELGHCLSGHVLYKTLLALLLRFSFLAFSVPLGGVSIMAIIMALREWDRKSELSADRAGLLVAQESGVVYNLQMKMAGGGHTDQMDIGEFFRQAAEYEGGGTVVDGIYKLLNLVGTTHPFPVLRLTELKNWVDSGAYRSILTGDYTTRDEAADGVRASFRRAADQYKEDFASSKDPLADALRNAAENMDAAKNKAKEMFDSLFSNNKTGA